MLTIVVFSATAISPDLSLWLIIIGYMVFNIGGGTSTLAFQDVVAKVVPAQRRGSFFGTRQLLGGLLTVAVAGPLVRWLLGEGGPVAFPHNFGLLCLISLVFYTPGLLAFAFVREPPQLHLGVRMRVIEGCAARRRSCASTPTTAGLLSRACSRASARSPSRST